MHSPTAGSQGGAVSYEPGTPVQWQPSGLTALGTLPTPSPPAHYPIEAPELFLPQNSFVLNEFLVHATSRGELKKWGIEQVFHKVLSLSRGSSVQSLGISLAPTNS